MVHDGDERMSGVELLALYGDGDDRMGAFLPGLTKAIKKVGKVTSGITTGLARTVGVPQSALNALAHVDPTKGKPSATAAVAALKKVEPVKKEAVKIDAKKIAIIAGGGVGALILLKLLLGAPRRS
jgi:hypothetical protein